MTAAGLRRARWQDLDVATAYAILRLRVDVFVVEQDCPYPELDGLDTDPGVEHVWLETAEGSVVAYLRVLPEPDVAGMGAGRRIGRVVVARSERNTGLAARLMDDVMARRAGDPMVLDSQAHAQDFYARWDFTPIGETFLEDGIPHRRMVRGVTPQALGTRSHRPHYP